MKRPIPKPQKQDPPSGPMRTRDVYAWNAVEAARNDVETVANIRAFLGRQHRINLATGERGIAA